MQPSPIPGKRISIFAILLTSAILISACQPLGLRVEQVSAQTDLLSVRAPDCSYGGRIKSIEALDEYTVRFTLCSADPAFLNKIAYPVFAIQDQQFLAEKNGDSNLMSELPNGTGPYRSKLYVPGSQLVVEANPDYWGIPAKDATITFRWASSPVSRLSELRYGQVDITDRPESNSYFSIRSDPSLKLVYRPALNVSYLGMNNQFPPFNDERVRRAFSLLLDRQQIINNYYPLGSDLADQFLPPALGLGNTPGYKWHEYNPEEAANLLKEAGFDFNQTIELAFSELPTDYLPIPVQIAQEIKSQLTRGGVKVILARMEPDAFQSAVADGQIPFYLSGWKADYPDPANFYETVFAVDSHAFGQPYTDITFMGKEAGSTVDPKDRESRYNRINELIRLHVPAIPLAHGTTGLVASKDVLGLVVGPLNENFEDITTASDNLRFMQSRGPVSLWPGDESDEDTLRITRLLYDTLVEYETGGTGVRPSLAVYWESDSSLTTWTFSLRYGVKFSNGAVLDANDVVASFAAQWDAASPMHQGRTGEFVTFKTFFGEFLNAPPEPTE